MPEETSPSTPGQIRKLLVANRGEIALRVFRTAHELGIRIPRFSGPVEV